MDIDFPAYGSIRGIPVVDVVHLFADFMRELKEADDKLLAKEKDKQHAELLGSHKRSNPRKSEKGRKKKPRVAQATQGAS